MEWKRHPVGTVRAVDIPMYEWCANTYEREMIWQGFLLLIVEDRDWYRVFCLDDGRIYHISRSSYDLNTSEPLL